MDIVRRNTDYALRAMVNLARNYEIALVSSRTIALQEKVPYQLACKLMQKLHKAKLIESTMGPKGGFCLSRKPDKITLLEVIEAMQESLSLNRCLLSKNRCPKIKSCTIRPRLFKLQDYIGTYLNNITLAELAGNKSNKRNAKKK